MRKLLSLAFVLTSFLYLTSCNEDDPESLAPPSVTNPAATSATVNGTITVSFSYTAEAGFASSNVTASGGTALVTTDGTADATSGTIEVEFEAGASAGAGSVVLTVTDADGNIDEGTAVISISASAVPSITGIPTAAALVLGGTLTVPDVALTAADGFASFTATVNGGSPVDLASLITVGETSATVDLEFTTEALGAVVGANTIVFTLTDADADAASVTHVLSVEALGFNVVEIDDDEDGVLEAIEITGSINTDYTFNNDQAWILAGRVKVTDGATLTIEEGSVIKGREGTGGNATALLVTRGSYIEAVGTATMPIVMTSINDDLTTDMVAAGTFYGTTLMPTDNGEWGGLIVLGDAPIAASADEVQIEGIPTTDPDGLYGGDNAAHDAGTIQYVSVRHGGTLIGSGNEINGITFGGVGSGTIVDHVEVVGNQDDGIEWFGGDVSATNVLVWNSFDDGLDTDQDWQGSCTNFIVVSPDGSAFELDGPEGGKSSRSGGSHQFTDGTVYAGASIGNIVDWDDDTNAGVENLYVYGLPAAYTGAIASFGGDGSGTNANWEVTLTDGTVAEIFGAEAAAIITERAEGANTVGADASEFADWTYASASGALMSIGLE